jgi:hypothetical protein
MSEMVERVARAICAAICAEATASMLASPADVAEASAAVVDEGWVEFAHEARIAIEAMREPTEVMVSKGQAVLIETEANNGESMTDEIWHAMIDAALKE